MVPRHRGHLVGVERVERDAVARQRDRRLDQLAPRQLAELAVRVARGRARRRGCPPRAARCGCRAVGVPSASRYMSRLAAPRRHLAVVDGGAAAVRQPDHHEPAAADVAGGGMGDAEREARRRRPHRPRCRRASGSRRRCRWRWPRRWRPRPAARWRRPGSSSAAARLLAPPRGQATSSDAASSTATDADSFIGRFRPARAGSARHLHHELRTVADQTGGRRRRRRRRGRAP